MTPSDDVRKLRERGDYLLKRAQDTRGAGAWDDFNGWASDNWPAISRALAALERERPEPCSRAATDADWESGIGRGPELDADDSQDGARRASSDGPTLVEEITEYLSGLLPNTRNCARSALLLARARDEIMRLDGLLGEHWKLARVEQRRIAALESRLAAQAAVIAAARKCKDALTGLWKPPELVVMCEAIRALDAKEPR